MADEDDALGLDEESEVPASDRKVKRQDNKTIDPDSLNGDNQLKSIVERIERLEEEKKTVADDIKEVYAEAKGNGYDTKILRKVIALRKRDLDERKEEESILELYLDAVGHTA